MSVLAADDARAIEQRIARLEEATGIEAVAAVVPRADRYPEVAWRGFALGVGFCTLASLLTPWLDVPSWAPYEGVTRWALLVHSVTLLGGGALVALIARAWAPLGRLLVPAWRAEAEARQCAESLFLERELFRVPERNAVLVLVSLFERRVVVLPDTAWRERVSAAQWHSVVEAMTPLLAASRWRDAFLAGFDAIEALLQASGCAPVAATNDVPDTLLEAKSP